MNIQKQGMNFFEQKIKEYLGVEVATLDFATHDDGVYVFGEDGHSHIITNNADIKQWFESYEKLKYGEVS